jgi:hypothetical protein
MGQGPDFEQETIGVAFLPQIRVDLASFATLRDTMTSERDLTLRPNVSTTLDDYLRDPGLAAGGPSMNMAAFRDQYGPCLQDVLDRLNSFISESDLLVSAASTILHRYRTVDQLRAASVEDITDVLTEVQTRQKYQRM